MSRAGGGGGEPWLSATQALLSLSTPACITAGPNKPCYLCGKQGHSTMTCPFRCGALQDSRAWGWSPLASELLPPTLCRLCLRSLASAVAPTCCVHTCRRRIAPGHGCTAAAGISNDTVLCALRKREQGGRCGPVQRGRAAALAAQPRVLAAPRPGCSRRACRPPPVQALTSKEWQVDAAVLKLHSRRCTCLEFHPTQVSRPANVPCSSLRPGMPCSLAAG